MDNDDIYPFVSIKVPFLFSSASSDVEDTMQKLYIQCQGSWTMDLK